jgi:hypothetical protein
LQKWADYLISGVATDSNSNRIKKVEAHSDFGCMVCETAMFSRADVIANIKQGLTYSTVFRTPMGKWRKGDDVRLVTVDGVDFLRTDSQEVAGDQFDNVPEI